MIPAHQIEAVKAAVNLPTIVAHYLKLQRSGDHHVACCCFHNEKTASLHIWSNRMTCFGCGFTGDAITFLCAIEHWNLPEAVRYLADIYGITLTNKHIPRAAVALAKETAAHCEWWWNEQLQNIRVQKAEAYAQIEEEGFGEAWEWLEFLAVWEGRMTRMSGSQEVFTLFKSMQPSHETWRLAVEEQQRIGSVFLSLLSL